MPLSPALPFAHERVLGRPACPRCGEILDLAEAAEFSDAGHARHQWKCDGCDLEFETVVRLEAA
jgi:hypothetical protein